MTFSLLSAATLVGALLIGLIPTLVDGIQKSLQAKVKLPDGRVDWFVRLFYLAWLPAMPLAGWLLDSWNNKDIFLFGLFGLIVGVAWLALVRSSLSLMFSALFLGLAYSFVTTAAVRFMPLVFFAPEEVQADKLNIAALNAGFVMVGIGALLGPWLVLAVERLWGYRQGLLYVSVTLIGPAALAALCHRPDFPMPPESLASWDQIFMTTPMALVVGVILLYFAVENCLEFWPEPYLKELGYQERGMRVGMSIFWMAFIGTRAAAAWLFYEHPGSAIPLTIALVFLSAFVLGNLSGGFELGSGSLGFWLVGACYGPLLPGFLGMALDLYPKPLPASVLGMLLALSGLDTLIVRPLMTAFGTGRPARTVIRAPIFIALLMAIPLVFLVFWRI